MPGDDRGRIGRELSWTVGGDSRVEKEEALPLLRVGAVTGSRLRLSPATHS